MAVLRLNGELVLVESLEDAGRKVDADREASGVGATEWYSHGKFQGYVREGGKVIGHVSYNGRTWAGAAWKPVGA